MVIVLTLAPLLPSWPLNVTACHFWQSAGVVGIAHLCCISTPRDMFNVWLDLHQLSAQRQTWQNEDRWIWIADTSGARVKWPVFLQTYCIYSQVQALPELSFSRSDEVRRDYCVCTSMWSLSLSASFSCALSSFFTLPAPFTPPIVTLFISVVETSSRLLPLKTQGETNTYLHKGHFTLNQVHFIFGHFNTRYMAKNWFSKT